MPGLLHEDVYKLLFPLKNVGGKFDENVSVIGKQLDAVNTLYNTLLQEIFPDTTTDLIADWERKYAIIPPEGATLEARRLAVVQKKRLRRRLDRQYFIALAATVGYDIDIEYIPANDARYGGGPGTRYIWLVHVISGTKELIYFTAGDSAAGDRLLDWETSDVLENLFTDLGPAHKHVYFAYEE